MADEEVVRDEHGYRLIRALPLDVEAWNAQLSLLTGMAAARIMLDGGIGILRTMPPPETALRHARAGAAAIARTRPHCVSVAKLLRDEVQALVRELADADRAHLAPEATALDAAEG